MSFLINKKNYTQYSVLFTWSTRIMLHYKGKEYPHVSGQILFDMNNATGSILLKAVNKEDKDIEMLESPLNKQTFETFAKDFGVLETSSVKSMTPIRPGIRLPYYNTTKTLIETVFPDTSITLLSLKDRILSLKDRMQINWKYILGGLGLASAAGLGYAYYKYYHAK
jgi:hypothetical protein